MSAASTPPSVNDVRTDLAEAVGASRTCREEAERALRLAVAVRSRAAEALERTARRAGVDETERARLRSEYAAAARAVAERQAALDTAHEFERAATVVADAFETEASSASPLAAALLELIGSQAARTSGRGRPSRTSTRRTASARLGATRPRTA